MFVTHQLDELLRLANRYVAAVDDGRVVFAGPTADFLARPELLGDTGYHEAGTLLRARPIAHQAVDGLSVLALGDQRLYVPQLDANNTGDEITVHVRALDVILAREVPTAMSALNRLAASITCLTETADGQGVDVQLDVAGQRLDARITRFSAQAMQLAPGDTVTAIIKSLALAEQAWQRLGGF